jgi:negative regulator of flagellin synthesis FlgM
MADPVTGLLESNKVRAVQKTVTSNNTTQKSAASTSTADVKVQLTNTLKSIESISAALAGGDIVDHAKVNNIRSAIESGDYAIDTDRIAKKFLELEKLLKS